MAGNKIKKQNTLKSLKFFLAFIVSLFLIPFILSQELPSYPESTHSPVGFFDKPISQNSKTFSGLLEWLFGFRPVATWGDLIMFVLISLILIFAFRDILLIFTPFSDTTNKIIAVSLALIAAFARLSYWIARVSFTVAASIGAFGVGLAIILAFASFIVLLTVSDWLQKFRERAVRRMIHMKALKEAEVPAEAWQKLKEFEMLTKKGGGS
jgi:hypothetical protein